MAERRTSPRSRRARLEVDERRAQLVSLALELFGEKTYEDVSIDDIARAAGISKGLLYHYFPTKRHFYVAGLGEGARRLLEAVLVPRSGPPRTQLRDGLDAYLTYVDQHAPAFLALFRGGVGTDPQVTAIVDETRRAVIERLLADAPELTATPLAKTAIRGWIGMVESASIEWLTLRAAPRDEVRDLLAEVLFAALTAAARPR